MKHPYESEQIEEKDMSDAAKIRTVLFERDADTGAQCVLDIREQSLPAASDNSSWTALMRSSDVSKRALLLELSKEIDRMAAGSVHEITLCVER
jgi:hypothetical protein